MDMEEQEFEIEMNEYNYSFFKGLSALMFVDKPLELFISVKSLYLGDIDYPFLTLFSGTILAYRGLMNEKMKENAHVLIGYFDTYFRESKLPDRDNAINLCNELSRIVNSDKLDYKALSKNLISEMVARGYGRTEAVLLTSKNQIDRTYDVINNQRVLDFSILYTHVVMEDSVYFNALKEAILNNETDYLKSLTFIIMEYPKLLLNKMFLDRLNGAVDALEDNNMEKFDTKYQKYMRKELKRFNRMFE